MLRTFQFLIFLKIHSQKEFQDTPANAKGKTRTPKAIQQN